MRKSTWVYLLAFIINCCLMSKYDEKYDSLEPDIIFLNKMNEAKNNQAVFGNIPFLLVNLPKVRKR